MNLTPKISILLSTYNGAKYLAEQLDSLLEQSYTNIVIVIRDDGSTDATRELISLYARKHENKIHQVCGDNENRGARDSFSYLIEYVLANKVSLELDAAYMMLCDQDDIWFADKIEQQVAAMLIAEEETEGNKIPLLIHSDLQVVSEQ